MKPDINDLLLKSKSLFEQKKFEEITELISDETLKKIPKKERAKIAELYIWRGNAWYEQKNDNNAIADYSIAIDVNSKNALAFYNRGLVRAVQEKYNEAITDYCAAIDLEPNDANAYVIRGNILRTQKKYDSAISDYNKAIEIDTNFENAYFNRGIAKKEQNVDLVGSKQDFEKYLELTNDKNDTWARYASYYVEEINELKDIELSSITLIIKEIKNILIIEEDCITHYTSLTVLKSLILESKKFRLSEGNFMNDPSEGKEFFFFLNYKPNMPVKDGLRFENFSPKPFIGSFVTKDKSNDLNMWRFYGKEDGEEAKGCAITLHKKKFTDRINTFLSKEREDYIRYKSDINFYRVAYFSTDQNSFYIPESSNEEKLGIMMNNLKEKVSSYEGENKASLERYLNSIAFLFKSDVYKTENEVRLVVTGIEFKRYYNEKATPPRVYIELESIKEDVEQITLGPKVDKVREWAAAFHYSFEISAPKIIISHLPYQ